MEQLALNLNALVFVPQIEVPLLTTRISNTVTLNGIASGSAISISGGEYRIDAGGYTSVAGTINPGQTVTLRQTASMNCATSTLAR